ncbi:helix-turn-helix transcriptional regulator [Staphylococcus equorum]|uniref:helix-turn-helix transcriptional regulator n=1 Tax=Staphylococcus equorum TaxID=246432 RepID=UPI00403FE16D
MYINNKKEFTAREISEEFSISIRTAHRYLLEISELGIPLYTEVGKYGGYRVLENRILPPIIFNEEEAISIYFAFQSLEFYQQIPFDINIQTVKEKLHLSFPLDAKKLIKRYNQYFKFWNSKKQPIDINLKNIILSSVNSEILKISYHAVKENSIRKIIPIGLYAYSGNWYVPSYDLIKKEMRTFRVDRIKDITFTKKYHDIDFQLNEYLNNIQSDPNEHESQRLQAEFNKEGIKKCNDEYWLQKNLMIEHQNYGYIDLLIKSQELEYLKSLFLTFGKDVKIKSPIQLRNMLVKELESTLKVYES